MSDNDNTNETEGGLTLLESGAVIREADGKTIAQVAPDQSGAEAIKYAHHKFARYAAAILELMEAGPDPVVPVDPPGDPEENVEAHPPEPEGMKGTDPPVMDVALGDTTPLYVEWFKANHTAEEFRVKYKNGLRLQAPKKRKPRP